jgi:hypothetical protein
MSGETGTLFSLLASSSFSSWPSSSAFGFRGRGHSNCELVIRASGRLTPGQPVDIFRGDHLVVDADLVYVSAAYELLARMNALSTDDIAMRPELVETLTTLVANPVANAALIRLKSSWTRHVIIQNDADTKHGGCRSHPGERRDACRRRNRRTTRNPSLRLSSSTPMGSSL